MLILFLDVVASVSRNFCLSVSVLLSVVYFAQWTYARANEKDSRKDCAAVSCHWFDSSNTCIRVSVGLSEWIELMCIAILGWGAFAMYESAAHHNLNEFTWNIAKELVCLQKIPRKRCTFIDEFVYLFDWNVSIVSCGSSSHFKCESIYVSHAFSFNLELCTILLEFKRKSKLIKWNSKEIPIESRIKDRKCTTLSLSLLTHKERW